MWWISFLKEKKSNSMVLPVWVLKVFTIFGCLFVKKLKIKFESCLTENICQFGKSFLKPSSGSVPRIQIAAHDSWNDFKSCPYPENCSESKLWYTNDREVAEVQTPLMFKCLMTTSLSLSFSAIHFMKCPQSLDTRVTEDKWRQEGFCSASYLIFPLLSGGNWTRSWTSSSRWPAG